MNGFSSKGNLFLLWKDLSFHLLPLLSRRGGSHGPTVHDLREPIAVVPHHEIFGLFVSGSLRRGRKGQEFAGSMVCAAGTKEDRRTEMESDTVGRFAAGQDPELFVRGACWGRWSSFPFATGDRNDFA
jgi:hypothetical protein